MSEQAVAGDAVPVASIQERIWLAERLEPDNGIYNVPYAWRVKGRLSSAVLEQALALVIERNAILRTSPSERDGRLRLANGEPWAPELDRIDLRGKPAPERELASWLRELARRPFDLTTNRLLRAGLAELDGEQQVLFLCVHHLVWDAASLPLFLRELRDSYEAVAPDRWARLGSALPSTGGDAADDRAALVARLSDEIEPIALPRRRSRAAGYRAESVPVEFLGDLAAGAAKLGCGLDAVLLAGFHAVLSGYSGQYELRIVTVQNRRGPADDQVSGSPGLVPVLLRATPERDFHSLAATAATELAFAARHAQVPFDDVVMALDPAAGPPFDVLFWYEAEPAGRYRDFDLQLLLRRAGTGVSGRIVYNGLNFDADQMGLLAQHFQRVIEQAVADPHVAVSELDLVTEAERHTQLVEWNATGCGYPETTLHELVYARAGAQPDAVAITDGGHELTYGELTASTRRMAHALLAGGVSPGDLVALVLRRGAGQVQAMLAVLAAGAAYVPIDPLTPLERIELILSDSGTRWMITDTELPVGDITVLPLQELAGAPDPTGDLPGVAPDDVAYCIYTSGTTGRPKGVLVTHRNVVRLVCNDAFPFELSARDVWTMFHSYAFDVSVFEVFCCFAHGGRLVVVTRDEAADTQRFLSLLRRQRVTVLSQTPSAFAQLSELALADSEPPLEQLRYVIFAGERLQPGRLDGWSRRLPALNMINMYGITETTVHSTVRAVSRADIDADISNIGRPIPTTTLYLLDRHNPRRLLPVGAVGELYVGGDGVAAGYLRRPELDAERFVPNPFGAGRLFRSGDLARYRPDGTLEYLGRKDRQIKLRGYRIEPGEIEARLREHPAIADAAVLLEGGTGGRLVAYLRCPDGPPATEDLRVRLGAVLPGYMVPAVFYRVDRFPLTSNGKLDQYALAESAVALSAMDRKAPATATGRLLAGIFASLLRIPEPGADESFFDLGGHSLLAGRLVGEIAARTGVRLPLRDLFLRPTLQDLADHIDAIGWRRAEPPPAAEAVPDGAVVSPASGMQEQMWLAEQLDPTGAAYTVPTLWRVTGALEPDVLRTALGAVIERHEILRTAFAMRDGQLCQVVQPAWVPDVVRVDLRPLTAPERAAEIGAQVDAEARTPFELGSGRPLRVRLLDCAPGEQLLLVCLHHMVCDAQSMPVFLRDLGHSYTRVLGRQIPDLPAPVQFGEVARDELAYLGSADGEYGLNYWATQLAGAPDPLDLGSPVQPGRHGAVPVPFSADFAEACNPLQTESRASWFMVAVAAVAAMLHRWSGSDDVTFAMPVANRERDRHAEVLGPCLNTVLLRSRHKPKASFTDLLAGLRESILDAFEHQSIPLSAALARLNLSTRGRHLGAAVNLVKNDTTEYGFGAAVATAVPFDRWQHETKFGLTVTFIDSGGAVSSVLSYRGDRFTASAARRMANWLGELLDHVTELARLPLDRVLPVEGAQYRDFALAQVAARSSAAGAAGVEHWNRVLAGAPPFLAFNPPTRTEPPGAVPIELADDTLERLRPVRAEHGVSGFMIAATALAALLHRWTGQDDVVFGCPVANRDEFPDVLGPCLNTVVLRSQCPGRASVLTLLRAMRDTVLDAFDHQSVPFEDVVQRLNPPRRPGWTPYTDVLLAVTPDPGEPPVIGEAELSPFPLDHDGAGYAGKLGLTVGLEEVGGRVRGTILYRGDRFTNAEVRRMARWLGRFLEDFATLIHIPVCTLDLVDDVERAEIVRFEQTAPAPEVTSVPALLAERCGTHPEAPAVRSSTGVLTYRALDERASVLAAGLRPHARGTRPVVALLLPRGADLVVSMLAAWKAGFAFCPLDPVYPANRIRLTLEDLGACAVVTDDPGRIAEAKSVGLPVIDVADPPAGTAAPDVLPDPEATAYVLYTSGTTGEPKGVEYSHRSLAGVTRWHIDTFGVRAADRVSQVHSVAFDMTEYEVWPALCAGAELLPYEHPVVVPELVSWLDEQEVTLFFTPTPLAEAVWSAGAELPGLRWMIFAGSPLTELPPATGYRICDAYGPTETFITTTHVVDPATATVLNCVGRPIAGVRLYVLDEEGQRCPVGVPGEIHVGGATVAKGYWQRETLTRQRFSAVNPDGGPGWLYRTGDRGRWLPDGTLEYLGRLDRQLKIRGYRVEPQEIEFHLRRDPLVRHAVVHALPGDTTQLVAYLVARAAGRADTQAVLARLKLQVPGFMVPGAVVWRPELPLNSRGKVDRDRLPRPGRDDMIGQTPWVAPETGLEQRIAAVWSGVLGVDSVGAHDNFFDLGGNSLLLAALHARLQAELATTLPIRRLFEYPTVHTLARALVSGAQVNPAAPEALRLAERAQRSRARRIRQARVASGGRTDE
jgi:amino acid adenylation domain-containing protein